MEIRGGRSGRSVAAELRMAMMISLGAVTAIAAGVTTSSPTVAYSHASEPANERFVPAAASFVTPRLGWVLGTSSCAPQCATSASAAVLVTTDDGGAKWRELPRVGASLAFDRSSTASVDAVVFANRHDGYLYGPGLFSTRDGGESWTQDPVSAVASVAIASGYTYAVTGKTGSVVVWRCSLTNGTWVRVKVPTKVTYGPLPRLAVQGATVLLLQPATQDVVRKSGRLGSLWLSRDRGASWSSVRVPCRPSDGGAALISIVPGEVNSWLLLCFNNEQSLSDTSTENRLYATRDGGRTWVLQTDPADAGVPEWLAANGSGHEFLASGGVALLLFASLNGGRSWRDVVIDGGVGFDGWSDVEFVTPKFGYLVGPTHGVVATHLYVTTNAGASWRTAPVTL